MILIVIDAHSKWIEAHPVSTISSAATIEKLRATFATFGLPDSVVSDNASVFTSHEFTQFLSKNGIEQILVSPYHPASNGLAERAVQTVKEGIRKQLVGSLETRLSRFLLTYRVTPHSTTGVSPCELLQGRKLRTQLDLLRPDRAAMVTAKQMAQKDYHDRTARERSFTVGESVKIRDVIQQKWLPATVTAVKGPCSYECVTEDNKTARRHVDHVIATQESRKGVEQETETSNTEEQKSADTEPKAQDIQSEGRAQEQIRAEQDGQLRRSGRATVKPDKLTYETLGAVQRRQFTNQ
jgi:hypothetical protein